MYTQYAAFLGLNLDFVLSSDIEDPHNVGFGFPMEAIAPSNLNQIR